MKSLIEYLNEAMVNERKITCIQDEIAFWSNPKTEKELIRKTGLDKDFVHDAVMYILTAVTDTLEFGDPDSWSVDATIEYFTNGDFVEHFTEEGTIYSKWGKKDGFDLDKAAEEFGHAALAMEEKLW